MNAMKLLVFFGAIATKASALRRKKMSFRVSAFYASNCAIFVNQEPVGREGPTISSNSSICVGHGRLPSLSSMMMASRRVFPATGVLENSHHVKVVSEAESKDQNAL